MFVVSKKSWSRSGRKSIASPTPSAGDDWPAFIAAVAFLSPPNRTLIAQICRQLEVVQANHGDAVAEAAIERVIRAIESEDGRYLS
jgi:hypothetical protein